MTYFVLEHDRRTGENVIHEFTESGPAYKVLNEKERDRLPHVEVVLLRASSLDQIRQSHSRYFLTLEELLASVQEKLALAAS